MSYEAASLPSGQKVYTRVTRVDSMVYENGALIGVHTSQEDTIKHSLEKYMTYEFSGRATKGDQLHNHRQTIMKGIANIPFQDGDGIADAFGRLSAYLEYEWLQYSPYPVQHSRVRMWDGRYDEFTTTVTFDAKNRLTRLTWFVTDLLLDPCEYLITYYK
ncbi:MAG: hypothetical protein EOP50_15820 [Sphingobacteriales bacterium]|nr:MAG: hypothetical protein EOP50_15820 [Sphingobacteriales bacterium]